MSTTTMGLRLETALLTWGDCDAVEYRRGGSPEMWASMPAELPEGDWSGAGPWMWVGVAPRGAFEAENEVVYLWARTLKIDPAVQERRRQEAERKARAEQEAADREADRVPVQRAAAAMLEVLGAAVPVQPIHRDVALGLEAAMQSGTRAILEATVGTFDRPGALKMRELRTLGRAVGVRAATHGDLCDLVLSVYLDRARQEVTP